jgi:hypothetical protein
MKRNNSLSTLILAFWIGGLIGLLIRRHRERQLRRVPPPVIKSPPVIPPPVLNDENGLPATKTATEEEAWGFSGTDQTNPEG